jgi:hypothetical protein
MLHSMTRAPTSGAVFAHVTPRVCFHQLLLVVPVGFGTTVLRWPGITGMLVDCCKEARSFPIPHGCSYHNDSVGPICWLLRKRYDFPHVFTPRPPPMGQIMRLQNSVTYTLAHCARIGRCTGRGICPFHMVQYWAFVTRE